MEDKKQLVVIGLGNPGKKYEMTRHNIGYLVVQAIAHMVGWRFTDERRFEAFAAKGMINACQFHLVLPTTYMNESGKAVRKYIDFYKLTSSDIVVVSDDVDLPFGVMRLKKSGSAGGHNGLKSVEKHLGTRDYLRLKIGIGEKTHPDLAEYVLDRFSADETAVLGKFIDGAAKVILRIPFEETDTIMNDVNTKVKQNQDLPLGEGQENQK